MPPPLPYQFRKVAPPKGLRDLPRYLRELLGGFFSRFGTIVSLVWKSGKWILFALGFVALLKGVAPAAGALLSRTVLNLLQTLLTKSAGTGFWETDLPFLLGALFFYRIFVRILTSAGSALQRIAGEKVTLQVKLQMMQKSKQLDLSSFDDPVFYEKMENANREAGMRPLNVLSETLSMVSTIIELVSYLVILFAVPGLGWAVPVILAVSIPSAVVTFSYRRKNFHYMRFRSKERRQMSYYSDTLTNKDLVKEVRSFDLADFFIGSYLKVFAGYYKGLRKLILSENLWHIAFGVLSGGVNLVFTALIAAKVLGGELMLGDYTLYTGAIVSVATAVTALISTTGTIYEGTLFIDNLNAFLREEQHVTPRLEAPLEVPHGVGHRVEFRNVSFHYPGSERLVVDHVSFTAEPGETLALVGLNGAGKTTLIKLLMRLYDPTEGEIFLDGHDLRDYDLKSLYRAFGTIFQDFGKYAFTVEENIRFGDLERSADAEEVREAARQSAAEEFISRLKLGYETPLMRVFEPTGTELSIGQWQKLAVARAFYSDSDILILDEPTASLDPMAEQEIFSQLDRLRENKTTVFVSHRLSSATAADRILVLENGRLEECGAHAELMSKKGKYYELFTTQARRYLETREAKA